MGKKTNKRYFWYGVLAMLLGSVNAPIIKYVTQSINPATFNVLRFSLTLLVMLPFFILNANKLTIKNLQFAIFSGFFLSISTLTFAMAIKSSTVSYIALLTLLDPITLVYFSIKITNEKINFRHLSSFILALLGALIIITSPLLASGQPTTTFYPIATLLALLMVISYPLAIIFSKLSNESYKKLPYTSIVFVQAFVVTIVSFICAKATKSFEINQFNINDVGLTLAIIYSGIVASVINRILNVLNYQKIGSAINGALWYCGIFITLIISVKILNEPLSIFALFGGAIILIAVMLSEQSLTKKYRYHR